MSNSKYLVGVLLLYALFLGDGAYSAVDSDETNVVASDNPWVNRLQIDEEFVLELYRARTHQMRKQKVSYLFGNIGLSLTYFGLIVVISKTGRRMVDGFESLPRLKRAQQMIEKDEFQHDKHLADAARTRFSDNTWQDEVVDYLKMGRVFHIKKGGVNWDHDTGTLKIQISLDQNKLGADYMLSHIACRPVGLKELIAAEINRTLPKSFSGKPQIIVQLRDDEFLVEYSDTGL